MTSADVSFAVDGLTVGTADLGGEPEFRFAMGTVLHDADLGEQLTRTASGTVATAATAYAGAALRSVAVKGRSVQDGTPTPDAPVAIDSIDSLTLMVGRGDQSDPTATPLDLDGHALRSLPDGTCDEAVWTAEGGTLTQRVGIVRWTDNTPEIVRGTNRTLVSFGAANQILSGYTLKVGMCTHSAIFETGGSDSAAKIGKWYFASNGRAVISLDPSLTDEQINAMMADACAIGTLRTPATHALPTSPLPDAPAADMAVWAESEPSTEIDVEYRESIQLAVDEIREAIASIV